MEHNLNPDDIDNLVISSFPSPISANYQKMLEAENWETKTRICIEVFGISVRIATLSLISNYIKYKIDTLSDPIFDKEIRRYLPRPSLGSWVELLFMAIKTFHEKQDLIFIPELYELYWNTSTHPHRPRLGIRSSFNRLVEIRNTLVHQITPSSEGDWSKLGKEILDNLRKVFRFLSFFQDYHILLVEKQKTGNLAYDYKLTRYSGLEPTYDFVTSSNFQGVKADSIYLIASNGNLLRLSPLIISYKEEGNPTDLAIFDRFLSGSIEYLATLLRTIFRVDDNEMLSEMRDLLGIGKRIDQIPPPTIGAKPTRVEVRRKLRAFLCHSSNDKPAVRKLYNDLLQNDIDAWLDEEKILPGQEWELEIEKAVQEADTVIVCLSKNSIGKAGYVQKELRHALDVADEQPEGTIFIIPVRLDDCTVPERLRRWQWVNLYEEKGFARLITALSYRASTLSVEA